MIQLNDTDTKIKVVVNSAPGSTDNLISTTIVSPHQWSNVVLTLSSQTLKLYINGSPAGSKTLSNTITPLPEGSSCMLHLGKVRNQATAGFEGYIRSVKWWDRALSREAIQALTVDDEKKALGSSLATFFSGYVTRILSLLTSLPQTLSMVLTPQWIQLLCNLLPQVTTTTASTYVTPSKTSLARDQVGASNNLLAVRLLGQILCASTPETIDQLFGDSAIYHRYGLSSRSTPGLSGSEAGETPPFSPPLNPQSSTDSLFEPLSGGFAMGRPLSDKGKLKRARKKIRKEAGRVKSKKDDGKSDEKSEGKNEGDSKESKVLEEDDGFGDLTEFPEVRVDESYFPKGSPIVAYLLDVLAEQAMCTTKALNHTDNVVQSEVTLLLRRLLAGVNPDTAEEKTDKITGQWTSVGTRGLCECVFIDWWGGWFRG